MPALREPESLIRKTEEFLSYCRARNLSEHTLRAYRVDLAQFLAFAGDGNEITAADLDRKSIRGFSVFLHDSGKKTTSVRRTLAAVKSFLKFLEAEELIAPSLPDSIPRVRRRDSLPDVPSEETLRLLLEGEICTQSPERDRLVLELLYGCGLRVSEMVGINMDDFCAEDILVIRGKGKRERFTILGEYVRAALKKWLPVRAELCEKFGWSTSALLLQRGSGRHTGRLDVRSVRRIVIAVAKSRGLDPEKWHPHLLRHSYATHSHNNGLSLQAIASLLGHARLSTTQIYARVSVERMKQIYNRAHPHATAKAAPDAG